MGSYDLSEEKIYPILTKTDPLIMQPSSIVEQLQQCGLFSWIEKAVSQNASDLFLSVGEQPTLKIYDSFKRIDGEFLNDNQLSEIIEALIPSQKKERYLNGYEVDIGLDLPGDFRFRVNIFRQHKGMALAIRPLPYRIPTIEELKLPDIFYDISRLARGLVLVTGPAGSGKSTTLASLINMINERDERHIVTIEDPIEYLIPNKRALIHQREVGCHTHSFSDGLRSALRENPDIIVVGELRDLESISLAIRAAETGHLVLGTMHTGEAIQAITRILDAFDSGRQSQIRIQLAQSFKAICSQRLLKRVDGNGMIVATEVLIGTLAVRNIIRENRVQELRGYMETGRAERMHTFQQNIRELIENKYIDPNMLQEMEQRTTIQNLSGSKIWI